MTGAQAFAASTTLIVLLALAVREDLKSHRIPNALAWGLLVLGLTLQALAGGMTGFAWGFAGAAVGLASLLPLYLARGMGAGDVKLMMATGTFLGPVDAIIAAMLSLVAGAALAIAVVAWRVANSSGAALLTVNGPSRGTRLRAALSCATTEKFPYAAAIAAGVIATLWSRGLLQPLAGSPA
jgi:prepilin peptidase CpaA